MHERGECILIENDKGPLAYLNLAFRPDLKGATSKGAVTIKIEEAPETCATLIRRMHDLDECIVVRDDKAAMAYFSLARRPDVTWAADEDMGVHPRTGPRVVYNPRTGLPVVTARFGARMVTAEEIYGLW
jgi:hypothetical protein